MKILYNIGYFSGGAPISMLEYAKISSDIHETMVIGKYNEIQKMYLANHIKTTNISGFYRLRNNFRNIIIFKEIENIILEFKPDLIHATSYGIVPSVYFSLKYNIPIIITISGGKITNHHLFNNTDVIVYSEENRIDLIKHKYKGEITLLSNRIAKQNYSTDLYKLNAREIKALLISRIDNTLMDSIRSTIYLIKRLREDNINICLDIIGSGNATEELKDIISMNSVDGTFINYLGYKDNPDEFIRSHHIIFGKGRSIIQSSMIGRYSVILGHDTYELLSTRNMKDHYLYNFSGRQLDRVLNKDNTYYNILETCKKIIQKEPLSKELEEIKNYVNINYSIENVVDDVTNLYKSFGENANYLQRNRNLGDKFKAIFYLLKVIVTEMLNFDKLRIILERRIK